MIQSMGVIWALEGTGARLLARLPSRLGVELSHPAPERRRRLVRRGLPTLLVLLGLLIAVAVGLVCGGESDDERAARRYTEAWERGDLGAMYDLLTPGARDRTSRADFDRAHDAARVTATAAAFEAGSPEEDGGTVRVPMTVGTRAFGRLEEELLLPVEEARVDWRPHLAFPGVPEGEELARQTQAPPRARIAARDGRVIAEGPAAARTSPLGPVGDSIAGEVGRPTTPAERRSLDERGFPPGSVIGLNGLERSLELQAAGTPGGTLRAGDRTLASTRPRAAAGIVRSTIDLGIQEAAMTALAGRFGGIAALDPRTGEIRALAGIAFSAPQPPGSTFKIVTAAAALEHGIVKPSDRFPVETKAVIDGVDLENANGESCGGTFVESFAHSCNSVFAPLGVRLGAERLVEAAERFGFNRQPAVTGAKPSTIPPPAEIDTPLAVGSTAIGQGEVLATPLKLAEMAQVVAADGVRHEPTLLPVGEPAEGERVIPVEVARQLERMMIQVVRDGTGTAASLAPVRVAGKTGTAELEDTTDDEGAPSEADPGADTDAWFTAYAPARRPKIVVAVMFVRAGAGGETAAPAAKIVLEAGVD
jgi:penicillin-binding protein A